MIDRIHFATLTKAEMSTTIKVTKDQLLKLIDLLEAKPDDKGRILGDIGITVVGAGLGAAAAGTLATVAGVTSIFGVTSIAGWLGLTVVAATPVGWVVGAAAAAGAAAYTVSRLIRNGGMSEGKKEELLIRYREEARVIAAKEAAGKIEDSDRTRFIVALRDLIDKDVIPPDVAFRFIEQVERGGVPISQAFSMIHSLLKEVSLSKEGNEPLDVREVSGVSQSTPVVDGGLGERNDPVKNWVSRSGVASFGSTVSGAFSSVKNAIGETSTEWIARAQPGINSVSIAASEAASSVGNVAGDFKNHVAGWFRRSPSESLDAEPPELIPEATLDVDQMARDAAPVIWLLGKTGAGKSSVIAKLTGASHAEVGNGFVPCTRTAQLFDFPQGAPLLRFMDTRGLGEPGYDPSEDLAWSQTQSHLILVVMRASDPSQEEVLAAVKKIRKEKPDWPMLVVQTGLHDLYSPDEDDHPEVYPFNAVGEGNSLENVPRRLRSALEYQRSLFETIKGAKPLFVPVDFTAESDGFEPHDYGKAALMDGILEVAPEGVRLLVKMRMDQDQSAISDTRMKALNMRILYWAAGAAAVGAAPVVGLVTVPVAQAAMLTQLATVYGVEWGFKDVGSLAGMLGVAIVANQGALLALRQLAKIGPWVIPIAAAQDYAVTYALGRAACVYLQARQNNTKVDAELVKKAFQEGLRQAFKASQKSVPA